jgi:hypothetical protein
LHAASGRVHDNRQQSIVTTTTTTTATNSQQLKKSYRKICAQIQTPFTEVPKRKKDETVE